MKRYTAVLSLLGLGLLACGPVEVGETMEGSIYDQNDPVVRKTLQAISLGQQDGDKLMTTEVNRVLLSFSVNFYYQGMTTLADYSTMSTPDVGGPQNCPYVGPKATKGSDTGPSSCRFLAEEALEQGQLALATLNPTQKIQSSFAEGDANLTEYRTWYSNGASSAVNVSGVLLAGTLRQKYICDQTPTPKTSAYQKGVELGRKLYIAAINEKLKEVGIDYVYPTNGGKKATKSIRYCQNNLRNPAIADAKARVASSMAQSPLCANIGNDPIEQSPYASQFQEINNEYKAGIYSGITSEDSLAQNTLRDGGCCIASPLVLDLAGDGLDVGTETEFDLNAAGFQVNTRWVSGDDALLVLDRNGNGIIDDGRELFGNQDGLANGFENLRRFDDNGDGAIDARDAVYARLRLWQDADSDGRSSSDELATLSSMGVRSISLWYTQGSAVDIHGSQMRQLASFERDAAFARSLGAAGQVVDIWFQYR